MQIKERSWVADNYPYGFNGQEEDDEINGEGNITTFKYRIYDGRLGRFLSIDPSSYNYPQWTPYQFAGLIPIRFLDLEGLEPGEPFKSEEEAALNFSSIYGKFSIQENREYSAAIYTYTNDKGETVWTYNVPLKGTEDSAPVRKPRKKEGEMVAIIHTHGAYKKKYDNNDFSGKNDGKDGDKGVAEKHEVPIYLAAPEGSLQKYDPATNKEDYVDNTQPSDPNDPDQIDPANGVIKKGLTKKETRKKRREYTRANNKTKKEYFRKYKETLKKRRQAKKSND